MISEGTAPTYGLGTDFALIIGMVRLWMTKIELKTWAMHTKIVREGTLILLESHTSH